MPHRRANRHAVRDNDACAVTGLWQHGSAISAANRGNCGTRSREIEQMSVRRSLFAAATASILALTATLAITPASAQTLRYANQGDLKSLDPYTLNESTTHAHLGHVFEG